MKRIVRLTESDLHSIVRESVNAILGKKTITEEWDEEGYIEARRRYQEARRRIEAYIKELELKVMFMKCANSSPEEIKRVEGEIQKYKNAIS
jgi:K+-transporting ATPase c subunit